MPTKQTERDLKRPVAGGGERAAFAVATSNRHTLLRAMVREFGADAAEVAQSRADDSLGAGDGAGFQAWLDIAAELHEQAALGGYSGPGAQRRARRKDA